MFLKFPGDSTVPPGLKTTVADTLSGLTALEVQQFVREGTTSSDSPQSDPDCCTSSKERGGIEEQGSGQGERRDSSCMHGNLYISRTSKFSGTMQGSKQVPVK